MALNLFKMGAILFVLLAASFYGGCGKKGDPLPPISVEIPPVSDLRAENQAEGILLSWTVSRKIPIKEHIRFHVYRITGERSCKECPEDWKLVREIPLETPLGKEERKRQMTFLDTNVVEGTLYRYRIVPVTESGQMGPPSSTVQIARQK